jgi:UDP-glucose 4-epimerase
VSTVLLTGSTGLIGAEIDGVLSRSERVVRLGRNPESDFQLDLGDRAGIESLDLPPCDSLVHCAGIVDEDVRSSPAEVWSRSTAAFAALIERALAVGARKFVYVSSAHVYGPLKGSIDESHEPDPRSEYALAHFAAEQTMKRMLEGRGSGLVLRPCAVFGRLRHPSRFRRWSLIPFSFPREAVFQGRIVLRSSGLQKRNFVSAGDMADLVASSLAGELPGEWTVMNPTGPETLSVREFAFRVADRYREITGIECPVEVPAVDEDDVDDFRYETVFGMARGKETTGPATLEFLRELMKQTKEGSPA